MSLVRPLLTALVLSASAQAAPDFSMMGFATTEGGTTGGKGGAVVTPTTLEDLKKYAEDKTTPYVIRITKEFNTGVAVKIGADGAISGSGATSTTYGDVIRLGSNKTLVGIGNSAFFNRIGIVIQSQSNIIIRNIKFTMKDVPIVKDGENKIVGWVNGAAKTLGDPDCIGIQADDETIPEAQRITRRIWIDHCEFYNEDPATMTDKNRYDGLLDGKNNSSAITISWCYFHDHHKGALFGSGGSDDFERHITYSHNHFENIDSRIPLLRFGNIHFLNNYVNKSGDGTNARINSDVYVEGNHYESTKKPVYGKPEENGAATLVGNAWIGCTRVPQIVLGQATGADALSASEEILAGKFKPSTFYSYKADAVGDVPALVKANAGVGKINTDEYGTTSIGARGVSADFAKISNGIVQVRASIGESVNLATASGQNVFATTATSNLIEIPAPRRAGIYVVRAGNLHQLLTKF